MAWACLSLRWFLGFCPAQLGAPPPPPPPPPAPPPPPVENGSCRHSTTHPRTRRVLVGIAPISGLKCAAAIFRLNQQTEVANASAMHSRPPLRAQPLALLQVSAFPLICPPVDSAFDPLPSTGHRRQQWAGTSGARSRRRAWRPRRAAAEQVTAPAATEKPTRKRKSRWADERAVEAGQGRREGHRALPREGGAQQTACR